MRLSTKGRYAVMAMADLARNGHSGGVVRAVSLAEIATRQEISLKDKHQQNRMRGL
jgi:Rrf2 family iron-sulfur cluster assembly transcriptional regulator